MKRLTFQKSSHRVPLAPITVQEEGHLFVFDTCFSGNEYEGNIIWR